MIGSTSIPKRRTDGRGGAALMVAIVAVAIVTLLMVAIGRSLVAQKRQLRRAEQAEQARLLAESALRRAVARLAVVPQYDGEIWQLVSDELVGRDAAEVAIRMVGRDAASGAAAIEVTADYPPDAERRIRVARELTLPRPLFGAE